MEEIIFTKKLVRSGNRVLLTVPKEISDVFGLEPGDLVEVRIRLVKKKSK